MEKYTILIVEDDEFLLQMYTTKLNLEGFIVLGTPSGKQGLKIAKKERPDFILLDIMLLELNGIEVLENLKRETDTISIPVVILSARKDEESKLETSRLYNEGYIEKPVETSELIAEIERVLQQKGGA